jgi:hypothetical protein
MAFSVRDAPPQAIPIAEPLVQCPEGLEDVAEGAHDVDGRGILGVARRNRHLLYAEAEEYRLITISESNTNLSGEPRYPMSSRNRRE